MIAGKGRTAGPKAGAKRKAADEPPSDGEDRIVDEAPVQKRGRGSKGIGQSGSGEKGRKKRRVGLVCGRCQAKQADDVPWPTAADESGKEVPVGQACTRCWHPYLCFWKRVGWTFSQICGKCAEDEEFNREYEHTCAIGDGQARGEWDPQRLEGLNDIGYEVSLNYALLKEKQLREAIGHEVTAKQLGEKLSSIPAPWGAGGKVSGVMVRHPSRPWVEVKVYCRSSIAHSTSHMTPENQVHVAQGQRLQEHELGNMRRSLPTSLRGSVVPPSIEDLSNRAKGLLAGGGAAAGIGPSDNEESSENEREDESAESEDEAGQLGDVAAASAATPKAPASYSTPRKSANSAAVDAGKLASDFAGSPASAAGAAATPQGSSPSAAAAAAAERKASHERAHSESLILRRGKSQIFDDAASAASGATGSGGSLARGPPQSATNVNTDMVRYTELARKLNPADILDGKARGSELYAAKRFRDRTCKDKGALLLVKKLVETCERAESLTIQMITSMAPEKRDRELAKLHSPQVHYPLAWCQSVIQAHIADCNDPQKLVNILTPFEDAGDEPQKFHPVQPFVSNLDCDLASKATFFGTTLVEKVILPWVEKGHAKAEDLKGLAEALSMALPAADDMRPPELSQEVVDTLDRALAVATAIELMTDPSPLRVEACSNMGQVRKILSGDVASPWNLIKASFEDNSAYWAPLRANFQANRAWDLEYAPLMRSMLKTLDSQEDQSAAVKVALDAVRTTLGKGCRKGGIIELETAILETLKELAKKHEKESETELNDLDLFHELVIVAQEVIFRDDEKKQGELGDLAISAGQMLESATKRKSSHVLLVTMSAFQAGPTEEALKELQAACSSNSLVRFTQAAHIEVVVSTMEALREYALHLSRVAASGTDGDDKQTFSDALNSMNMVFNLLADPGEKSKCLRAWAQEGATLAALRDATDAYRDLGDTPQRRYESEEAYSAWSCLASSLAEFNRKDWRNDLPENAFDEIEWERLNNVFAKVITAATQLADEHKNETIEDASATMSAACDNLKEWSGGVAGGALWKDGLAEDADWPAVVAKAEATLFAKPQRGLPKRLKDLRNEALKAKVDAKRLLEGVGAEGQEDMNMWFSQVARLMSLSESTIMEAKLIQNIARDTKTLEETRQALVQEEADRVQDAADLQVRMLHPTIWSRALRFIRGD